MTEQPDIEELGSDTQLGPARLKRIALMLDVELGVQAVEDDHTADVALEGDAPG